MSATHDPTRSTPNRDGESWFATWFDQDYLRVYAHRDERDAAAGVALLAQRLPAVPDQLVLDLACGNGRHLHHLVANGYRAVGLDLSPDLLAAARQQLGATAALIRADMRSIPLASGSVDLVTSFFTSFGYFDDDDNDRVLTEIARVLGPGGSLFLDYANRGPTIANLTPRSERRIDDIEVVERRRWDEARQRLEKTIDLTSSSGTRRILESVRLYEPEELLARLRRAGLEPNQQYGDATGATFAPSSSPRLIVQATRRPDND